VSGSFDQNGMFTIEGPLGIGTIDPKSKLEVNSGDKDEPASLAVSTPESDSFLSISSGSSIRNSHITWRKGINLVFRTADTGGGQAASDKMCVTDEGNVGIGVMEPAHMLHVNGDIKAIKVEADDIFQKGQPLKMTRWEDTENGIRFGGIAEAVSFTSSSVETEAVKANVVDAKDFLRDGNPFSVSMWQEAKGGIAYPEGNVGIGTDSPKSKLDIYGALMFNGNSKTKLFGDTRASRHAVVIEGHWNELEVKGRVLDWTGSNLHIGYENDHSGHGVYFGNGKLGKVEIQGQTNFIVDKGNVGLGTAKPAAKLDVNGTFRVGGGAIFNKIQAGTINVGNSRSRQKRITVKFPSSFSGNPAIVATASGTKNVVDTFAVTATAVSKTRFIANILRVDSNGGWGQNLQLDWIAWEHPTRFVTSILATNVRAKPIIK